MIKKEKSDVTIKINRKSWNAGRQFCNANGLIFSQFVSEAVLLAMAHKKIVQAPKQLPQTESK